MTMTSALLAFFAGVVGIVSPCVWPLIPVLMSANGQGIIPKLLLALGLALAFALAGGVLTWLLLSLNIDPVAYRSISAVMLLIVGLTLLMKTLADNLSTILSRLISFADTTDTKLERWFGPFGLGLLLGFVWLPCVGPTLGAAIALASQGQEMLSASFVMLSFGLGTATALLVAATSINTLIKQSLPNLFAAMLGNGKQLLGGTMMILGLLVLTGLDLKLEALVLPYLPEWSIL